MITQSPENKIQFRFKHWSRKGYAVFSSLGKQISIGRIIISVALLISGISEAILTELIKIYTKESEEEELDEVLTDESYLQLITVPVAECSRAIDNLINFLNITAVIRISG